MRVAIRQRGWNRGFTLPELLVVLGVVTVLIGLVLPSIGRSVEASRRIRDGTQLRQSAALVHLYCSDHGDVIPIAHNNAFQSTWYWPGPIVMGGYAQSRASIDPVGVRASNEVTYWLSVCMVYDPDRMLPGRTVPPSSALSRGVRLSNVPYPSDKALLLKFSSNGKTLNEGGEWFCCGARWTTPIAMCDASVMESDYLRLSNGASPVVIDLVGMPAYSTWGGYTARDR